jgi:hypothetical protein
VHTMYRSKNRIFLKIEIRSDQSFRRRGSVSRNYKNRTDLISTQNDFYVYWPICQIMGNLCLYFGIGDYQFRSLLVYLSTYDFLLNNFLFRSYYVLSFVYYFINSFLILCLISNGLVTIQDYLVAILVNIILYFLIVSTFG